jgi:small ligand-binding sensory domain FIST
VTGSDWRELCDRVLDQTANAQHGQLGFIYVAEELAADTDRIIDYLREHSGVAHWVGCVGMGLCSSGRESYEQAALSVLLTPFTNDDFRLVQGLDNGPGDWLEANRAWRESNLASVAVLHGNPSSQHLPQLLQSFSDGLQGGFLIGGIAAAQQLPTQIADRALSEALNGVLFSGRLAISTGLSQGCSLIGQRHGITACERNVIKSIDGRPALDVLKEDIGEVLARDLQRIGGYIFAALPIAGSDTGDYLVRNLIGVDTERGLVAIGDLVEPEQEIQFARRDAETAREDLVRMVKGLKQRLPGPPRGALYHSCVGRGRNLFGDNSAELRLIQEHLGEVPLSGFYANGEISHNRLYGYTGVLTLFS